MSQKAADGCREEEMQEEIRENITDGNIFPTCRALLALSALSAIKLKVIRVKNKQKKQTNITTLTLTILVHIHDANLYDNNLEKKFIFISNVHENDK